MWVFGARVLPPSRGGHWLISAKIPDLAVQSPCCLRTLTGARQFCAIRGYLSTAAKHDLGFFNALVMLTEGRPRIPAASLSPGQCST